MADDLLYKDLVPARPNSHGESHRSSIIDPRERLVISKLNRNDLEDKYLRLIEDYQTLKKVCNCQEDKLKLLSTKFMRICTSKTLNCSAFGGTNDKDKILNLIAENTKLKDKINLLRNQILSHRVLARPSSQNKRLEICHSPAITSCRSNDPMKSTRCQILSSRENNEIQNYITRIQELEAQRKKMMSRISELENKLELCEAGNQKEKIAENVEYIRVWRQMKLQSEKLIESEEKNISLKSEVESLRNVMDELTKNHVEVATKLKAEEELATEFKEQASRTHTFELDLRARDEKIQNLTSELKILQEHNSQIVGLKNSDTNIENEELKKKLTEIMADNVNVRNAFDIEQANIEALQAVNAQLREKLQDLQKSVETLTTKLSVFEKANELPQSHNSPSKSRKDEKLNNVLICEGNDHELRIADNHNLPKSPQHTDRPQPKPRLPAKKISNHVETSMQTEFQLSDWKNDVSKKDKACSTSEHTRDGPSESPLHRNNGDKILSSQIIGQEKSLTAEEMLRFLDDAQISTPISTQTTSKFGIDDLSPINFGNHTRRQRQVLAVETLLFSDTDYAELF